MSDNIRDRLKQARKGEGIAVRDLRSLGRKLTDVLDVIEELHERGCYVVQTTTGKRSDRHGTRLIRDNLHLLNKGAAKRIAKANGSKGGRPKLYEKNDRDEAAWHNVTKYKTDKQAAAALGVSVSTLWRTYGKSGRARSGRPRKSK